MVQAKDRAITEGGPGCPGSGTCTETHNKAGLWDQHANAVTPLHPHLSMPPMHMRWFPGWEWLSNEGTDRVTVSHFVKTSPCIPRIDHLLVWNEESSGIGVFNLWYGRTPGDRLDLVRAGG